MNPPRFSIVLACYNQRDFVRQAVESAIAQSHPSKEIIAVDDGSRDETPRILDEYSSAIRVVKLPKNQGPLIARNQGCALATGEYLVFLDGDDVLMPWTLAVYDRLIDAHHPKIIVGRRCYFQGEVPEAAAQDRASRIDYVNYEYWLQKDRMLAFGASNLVIHRQAFEDAGGWSPGIFHLDVTDLLLKLGLAGTTLAVVSPDTVWYRRHTGSVTRDVRGMLDCARVLLKKEKAGEYPGGSRHKIDRAVCLGGPTLFWMRRAIRAGLVKEVVRMVGTAWFVVFAAIYRRLLASTKGRRAEQSVDLPGY
jgi:glycosyltransferase involved in cell wall biosynthesis